MPPHFTRSTLAAGLLIALAFFLPLETQAQTEIQIGPQAGLPVGDVSDLGGNFYLGADARAHLASLPESIVLNPSFAYYLTDDFAGSSFSVFAVDLNGFYEFDLDRETIVPYAGGGIAITRISVDVGANGFVDPSSTELGLNLVGGARFPLDSVEPFAQLNVAAGAERIGITGGVLFSL